MLWSSSSPPLPSSEMLAIPDLIKEHKEKINELKALVATHLKKISNFQLKDQFFLLRYILSFKGDLKKASEAITKALDWRKANSDFVKKAMNSDHHNVNIEFPTHMKPYLRAIRKYLAAWGHKSTKNGQPVVICRMEVCNFAALVQTVPSNIIQDYILFSNEVEFWECDRLSRQTGKLHKAYRVIDLKKLPFKSIDRSFLTSFSNSSLVAEYLHPQLVGKTILLNSPALIKLIFELVKSIGVSKRALEKFWICKSNSPESVNEDIAGLIHLKDIPKFLGGECDCPNGCIPGSSSESSKSSYQEISKEINEEIELINTSLSDSPILYQDSQDLEWRDLPNRLESSLAYDDFIANEPPNIENANGLQPTTTLTK